MDSVRIEQGPATPWVGAKERISLYGWRLWFVVLALKLLRQRAAPRPCDLQARASG